MTLALVVGFLQLVAAAAVYLAMRTDATRLRAENTELRVALGAAHERLYGAWKDGFTLPDAAQEPTPKYELPESLARFVRDFDEVGQGYYLQQIAKLKRQGMDETAILRELTRASGEELAA